VARETCSVRPKANKGSILHGEKLVGSPHRVYSLGHLVFKQARYRSTVELVRVHQKIQLTSLRFDSSLATKLNIMTIITVLDYGSGKVWQYEVDASEYVRVHIIEAMLEEQGHKLKDIEYMIHADETINKIKIEL